MIRILAVDDMPQWRNFHKNALNEVLHGIPFELTLKNSATEAFECIQKNLETPFDLIISDLQMETDYEPELAGEWLIRNINSLPQYKTTPKILVSAAFNIKFISEKLQAEYLPKSSIIHSILAYELKITELLNS